MAVSKRLLEAIVEANHAAVEGRSGVAEFSCYRDCLPLAALTCIDPRLNKFFPGILGLNEEQFIWLRNAGNVISGTTSSTVRSIALAALVKNAKEIVVIGHTDCKMAKVGVPQLLERLEAEGIHRTMLPIANLHEFFGLFSSEKPNVIKGVGYLRSSPIIPPRMPVHGLLMDTKNGRLEWVINGYEAVGMPQERILSSAQLSEGMSSTGDSHYVSGPVRSLGEKVEPLTTKKREGVSDNKPPAASAAVTSDKNRIPLAKKRDKGPIR